MYIYIYNTWPPRLINVFPGEVYYYFRAVSTTNDNSIFQTPVVVCHQLLDSRSLCDQLLYPSLYSCKLLFMIANDRVKRKMNKKTRKFTYNCGRGDIQPPSSPPCSNIFNRISSLINDCNGGPATMTAITRFFVIFGFPNKFNINNFQLNFKP